MNMGPESTARTRELGADLRNAREKAGISGIDMAVRMGWSASKVSRLELGRRGTNRTDVGIYAAYCGVVRPELDRLLALADEKDDEFWLQPTSAAKAEELRSLLRMEQTASSLQYYESMVIPGLLQTEDYARALFREAGLIPEAAIEPYVRLRMARRGLLDQQNGPEVLFFIREHALRTLVGGAAVMHEQYLHLLLTMTQELCKIRILPISAGARAGLCTPFIFAQYTDDSPVVCVEHPTASLFLEGRNNVPTYRALLRSLHEHSLDEGESRSLLATLADSHDQRE